MRARGYSLLYIFKTTGIFLNNTHRAVSAASIFMPLGVWLCRHCAGGGRAARGGGI